MLISGAASARPPSKPCTDAPSTQWQEQSAVEQQLKDQGYEVRRVKVAMNCFEAYVIDPQGKMAELFLNPVSGEVVEQLD
jgi:hypothetical protein